MNHGRQLIDQSRGFRVIGDAEAEHGDIAEPEGETGHEADLGHLDGVETVGRIDAVAHRAAGEHGGADIVADRIAGEAGQRGDAIGNLAAADRAQGEQVVECQREIAGGDEGGGGADVVPTGRPQRLDHLVDIDIAQHTKQHHQRHGDDGEAEQHANAIPADRVLEKACHGTQRLEHLSSGTAVLADPTSRTHTFARVDCCLLAHDLIRKPVSTFRDHALDCRKIGHGR